MKHNDEVLFRNITADEKTKELIRKWMANAQVNYLCFASVLKTLTKRNGPFCLTSWSYDFSNTFICECEDNCNKKYKVLISLFLNGQNIQLDFGPFENKLYIAKEGKFLPLKRK